MGHGSRRLSANHQVISDVFRYCNLKDIDQLSGLLADQVEVTVRGDSELSGTYHGKEAALKALARITGVQGGKRCRHPRRVTVSDRGGIILTTECVRGDASVQRAYVDLIDIEDGKIVRFCSAPFCRDQAAPLAGPGEGLGMETPDIARVRAHSLAEIFAHRAAASPSAIAAEKGGANLTYGELAARAAVLAERLRAQGIGCGDRVGILQPRSLDALVAIVGVLYAGAVYVPLDPEYPLRRLQDMADDAEVTAAVVHRGGTCGIKGLRTVVAQPLSQQTAQVTAPTPVDGGSPAYIMFTSGSTGRAKPVVVPHRAIIRLVVDADYVSISSADRILMGSPLAFDASTFEIWGTLLNGACGVVVENETLLSPPALRDVIRTDGISVMWLTAAVFNNLVRTHPEALAGVGQVLTGGDRADPEMFQRVLQYGPPQRLINGYGPTENTTFSLTHRVEEVPEDATSVPIGRPIKGTTCVVLRDDGQVAGAGENGELCVGGQGLALGYYGDPALTAEKFIHWSADGQGSTLLYRTGDHVRILEDGTIDFLGRRDRQVKIRGFRVDLNEVESALRAHPAVTEAVVELETASGHPRLTAYVTSSRLERELPNERRLRADLSTQLPEYMLPARITVLERLPLNPHGKIDITRLPRQRRNVKSTAPTSEALATMAGLWCDVLKADDLGPDDDFFALGGDSLLAVQLTLRVQSVFSIPITNMSWLLRGLLSRSTLGDFSEMVTQATTDFASRAKVVDFEHEAQLVLKPGPTRTPTPQPRDPSHILLTGASGFTGAYLLERLLLTTQAQIHCPVRAHDAAHAMRRISNNLRRYGLDTSKVSARVKALPADLAASRLGLPGDAYIALQHSLDLIIHAAAHVNFLYPYSKLKRANVDATRNLIELAAARRIPIHHLSTIAVLAGFGGVGIRHVTEETPLEYPERLSMGYPETKWVAERLLQQASEAAGIPVAIYRPYEISGDLATGAWNTATELPAMFKMIADSGMAPDIDLPLNLVPVDRLAAAVIHITQQSPPTPLRTYHLTNPSPAQLPMMTDRLRHAGFEVDELPYERWVKHYSRFAAQHPEHPFSPFLPIYLDRSTGTDLTVQELYLQRTFPAFERSNTERALADSMVVLPPVTPDLLDLYLRYFHTSGFLPKP